MPNTRSKKKGSPYKALKTPARSPRQLDEGSNKKAKSSKKSSRMDRMEEQIAALTSVITSQLGIGGHHNVTPPRVKHSPRSTPKRRRCRTERRERAFPPLPEAIDDDPLRQNERRMNAGEIKWDDYDEMQRERLMICLSAPPTQKMVFPCPHFSAGNCDHTVSHEEAQLSLRHICPFCYAAGGGGQTRSPHFQV